LEGKSERGGSQRPERPRGSRGLREPRIAALIGVAIAVVIVVILLVSGGDDNNNDNGASAQATNGAVPATVDKLRAVQSKLGHPIYWAGAQPNKKYELTVTDEGRVYIRYLNPDVPIGSRQVATLTVSTYPGFDNAVDALKAQANSTGARTDSAPGGGFVLVNSQNPSSVYVAYPDSHYEIEVFDPDPARAFGLATSGAIVPVP
jgi:hypothetical protein